MLSWCYRGIIIVYGGIPLPHIRRYTLVTAFRRAENTSIERRRHGDTEEDRAEAQSIANRHMSGGTKRHRTILYYMIPQGCMYIIADGHDPTMIRLHPR